MPFAQFVGVLSNEYRRGQAVQMASVLAGLILVGFSAPHGVNGWSIAGWGVGIFLLLMAGVYELQRWYGWRRSWFSAALVLLGVGLIIVCPLVSIIL